jgi:hypothetical protein
MDRAKMFPRELELSEDGSLVVTVDQVIMGLMFVLMVLMVMTVLLAVMVGVRMMLVIMLWQ